MVQLRMGSLNAVVVSEGPDVKEVLHTKVNICHFHIPIVDCPTRQSLLLFIRSPRPPYEDNKEI